MTIEDATVGAPRNGTASLDETAKADLIERLSALLQLVAEYPNPLTRFYLAEALSAAHQEPIAMFSMEAYLDAVRKR